MEDKLTSFIRSNREEIKEKETIEGHEKRFEKKLLAASKQKEKQLIKKRFIAVAAVIIALITLGIGITPSIELLEEAPGENTLAEVSLGDVSEEMKSVELYYLQSIKEEKKELNQQIEKSNASDFKEMLDELEELEKDYSALKKALAQNNNNERIISSMIQNYKLRVQLLEDLQKMMETKNKKQRSNGNIKA
tara:strand:+ start:11129 stop:11704 length:576 start_codon:yes stop_codon:yes gene_type:complete